MGPGSALRFAALVRDDSGARCDGADYFAAFHAAVTAEISAPSGSRTADGVREKRGAGAGCFTP